MNLGSDFIPFFKKVTCKDEEIKNPGNNHGLTPFHIVCQKGHLDIAKMLVQNFTELKINFNDSDNDGHTGFHLGTIQILRKHIFGVNTPKSFQSITFALLGSSGVSNEAKIFKELNFSSFRCCFSVRIEQSSKISKICQKMPLL